VRDEVIFRCVNLSCGRALPRRVNYCPYCGINQLTALPRPVEGGARAADGAAAPLTGTAPTAFGDNARAAADASRAVALALDPANALAPAAVAKAAVAPPPRAPGVSAAPPSAAAPPRRQPVRLRWWLLALGALWLIWIIARPTAARLDARVDKAIALALACKANDAQAELIALKKTPATPAQLARLQTALDDADVACRRPARARTPTKGAARAAGQQAQSQSVRNLLVEARGALARGDYRAAADTMEVCVTMVDANTRECGELKARAERLDGERRRCLARGADWVGERCQ
jgi:hypothetical protein